jgi:CCR4-NOT transcription complex subunit 6
MFNQAHQQGQHVMMNGGVGHQRYMQMNMTQKYQHQPHQQHHPQQGHHQQQNHIGGQGTIGHQHTFSSGTISNATPHFASSTLHNGNSNLSQPGVGEPVSEHWQHQLQLATESRQAISTPHHHCKKDGVSRVNKGTEPAASAELPGDGEVELHRVMTNGEIHRQDWDAMDLSGQGLRALSPSLFSDYIFLRKLYIDNNRLMHLHPAIGQLRNLTHLDASNNELHEIPEEIGMLVNLKDLLLFDNNITLLPYEVGHLFKLEVLGIEGNPLDERLKEEIVQNGTKALVTTLRENNTGEEKRVYEHICSFYPCRHRLTWISWHSSQ